MNRHQPLTRTGWSLLELILVITVLGILTTLATQMFSIFFEADTRGLTETTTRLSMDRLTTQFRHDVHQAQAVTMESPQRLLLQTPTAKIVFEVDGPAVFRSVEPHQTKEKFVTGEDVTCRFEQADRLVKLTCTSVVDPHNSDLRTSIQSDYESPTKSIVAVPGWDLRFSDQEDDQ